MKQLLVLFIFLFLFISCYQIVPESTIIVKQNELVATKAELRQEFNVPLSAVKAFIKVSEKELVEDIYPLIKDGDTLMFICNFREGWSIISGDTRTNPVLAEDSTGQLDLNSLPEGIQIWLDCLAEDIWHFKREVIGENKDNTRLWNLLTNTTKELKATSDLQTNPRQTMKWYAVEYGPTSVTTTGTEVIPHLIQTQWGQGDPWNAKCPMDTRYSRQCYLGCTATAVAQLLYYTHYYLSKPNRLYHSISCSKTTVYGPVYNIGFSRSDLFQNSSRWDSMAHTRYGSGSGVSYAGDLMLDVGNRFNMCYSGRASGADIMSSPMYNNYDLHYSYGNYNPEIVKANLNNNLPVIVKAFSELGFLGIGYSKGHEWLIDGKYESTTVYSYYKRFEYSENWEHYSEVYDTFDEIQSIYGIHDPEETVEYQTTVTGTYWLMNWGYDGNFDSGHYSIVDSSPWNANGSSHLYNRKIYYDFY